MTVVVSTGWNPCSCSSPCVPICGSPWQPAPTPPTEVTLDSLTISPSTVAGGESATGTVTLTGPAAAEGVFLFDTGYPVEGAVVALSSSHPTIASVPESVVVPVDALSETFPITTTATATTTDVTITASYKGVDRLASLNVTASLLTKPVYWGRSTAEHLTTEAEVQALSTRNDSDYQGDFPVTDAVGAPDYVFLAWPQAFGGPVAPNGIMAGAFPASMADSSIGYGTVDVNGYDAEIVSVNGEDYLVYRLYHQTGGGGYSITTI